MRPDPLDGEAAPLARFLVAVERGEPFRDRFEDLLAALPPEAAYRLEWGSRESVGAAALMTRWRAGGLALVAGSGTLGTAAALGILGKRVVQLDTAPARLRFARARGRAIAAAIEGVAGAAALPFADATFSLVVLPDAPHGLPDPNESATLDDWLLEARRVLAPGGELLVFAQNRLAYKRFTGLHGRFEKPGALAYARRALDRSGPELTRRGYQRSLERAGFIGVRAFATYVSHLDYHYVSALGAGEWPALEVGPKEKKNLAKWAAHRLGLFGWLTPSFALVAEKPGGAEPQGPPLLDRLAAAAAPASHPRVEHLLATRGNAALALARDEAGGAGVVARVPLCWKEVRLARRHFEGVAAVRALGPHVPTPRIDGERAVEGILVFAEERVAGLNAAQLTHDARSRARTYRELAELLSQLSVGREKATDALLEELVFSHARFVASRVRAPETAELLQRVARIVGERLRGLEIPVVLAHADLRAKHCLVSRDGAVRGILDWGTYRARNLPLYDLIHFIVHDRKQESDESLNAATIRALHPRALAPFEEAAVALYCERLRIDERVRRACELAYPIEVPTTTMTHWDYDRPRWVEVNFGEALEASAREGRGLGSRGGGL